MAPFERGMLQGLYFTSGLAAEDGMTAGFLE